MQVQDRHVSHSSISFEEVTAQALKVSYDDLKRAVLHGLCYNFTIRILIRDTHS